MEEHWIEEEVEKIRKKLSDRNLAEVSRRSGVPYRSLIDFYNGKYQMPSASNYVKLKEYFETYE